MRIVNVFLFLVLLNSFLLTCFMPTGGVYSGLVWVIHVVPPMLMILLLVLVKISYTKELMHAQILMILSVSVSVFYLFFVSTFSEIVTYVIFSFLLILSLSYGLECNWIRIINGIFLFAVAWSAISYVLGVNPWGVIPGQTLLNLHSGLGFRVGIFPFKTPPFSAAISFLVLALNFTLDRKSLINILIIALSLYFIAFSASRTYYIITGLFLVLYLLKNRLDVNYVVRALMVISVFVFVNFILTLDASFIDFMSGNTALLRTGEDIDNLTRSVMIVSQLSMFAESFPFGTGLADYEYYGPGGSEVMLYKWLALYGVIGFVMSLPIFVLVFNKVFLIQSVGMSLLFSSALYSSFNNFYTLVMILSFLVICCANEKGIK